MALFTVSVLQIVKVKKLEVTWAKEVAQEVARELTLFTAT